MSKIGKVSWQCLSQAPAWMQSIQKICFLIPSVILHDHAFGRKEKRKREEEDTKTGIIPTILRKKMEFVEIQPSTTKIDDSTLIFWLQELAYCEQIHSVTLARCENLTDASIFVLTYLYPRLQAVDLTQCPCFTDNSIIALAKRCIQLETVDLSENFTYGGFTDECIVVLAQHCPQLKVLRLYANDFLTDIGILAVAEHCKQLQEVWITYSDDYNNDDDSVLITDKSVIALAENCPYLKHVDLSACVLLSYRSFIAIAKHCKQLQTVTLNFNRINLIDKSIVALAENCPHLKKVELEECDEITDKGIVALTTNCRYLESLNINSCDSLTDESVRALIEHCPSLKDVYGWCDKISREAREALDNHLRQNRGR